MPPQMQNPDLAAPGAGLPKRELFVARILLRWKRCFTSKEQSGELFQKERTELLRLARSCEVSDGARPVLIKRLPGMEDSSRYWSVFMTLHHLQIVNDAFANIIKSLTNGVPVEGTASTADVKPDPSTDATMIETFDQSCDAYLKTLAECPDLHSSITYLHPWFDELDAAGWHTLAALHMTIHRRQIELILKGISRK